MMNTKNVKKLEFKLFDIIGIGLTLLSFLVGTTLYLIFYYTEKDVIIDIGLWFFLIAFWSNLVVGVLLIVVAIVKKRKATGIALIALFMNIPVGAIYFGSILSLMSDYRVVLENNSDQEIRNIKLFSQRTEYAKIDSLASGARKKIIFGAKEDGRLDIKFVKGGVEYEDFIFGYITGGGNEKCRYIFKNDENIKKYKRSEEILCKHSELEISKKVEKN